MSNITYQIQRLDGYTDGKPSWCRWVCGRLRSKEDGNREIVSLSRLYPKDKFRLRKIARR